LNRSTGSGTLDQAEQNSEKELSTDTKKTKLSKAHSVLEKIATDEKAHLKAYEPLRSEQSV